MVRGAMTPPEGWKPTMMEYEQIPDKSTVRNRVESFTSYGKPACDICRQMERDDRPTEAAFWPRNPIHYIRGHESCAAQFWAVTLCEHHDKPEHQPGDATHRVYDSPVYIGHEHRMNSAYKHVVADIEVMG